MVTSLLLVVGLGGWAATTEFAGAVIAPGQVVVNSNVKKVQHPTGGIVGELRVRDGDQRQGRRHRRAPRRYADPRQPCDRDQGARRDGGPPGARRGGTRRRRRDRFPADLLDRMNDPDVAKVVNGERKQFEIRRQRAKARARSCRERITQFAEEIRGYEAQVVSKNNQIEWITKELEGVNELWRKNLVPYTRVTALERDKERLEGERGQLVATIAQVEGQDHRDRAADPADRSGHAQRGRQGPRRNPRQDRRARRKEGRRRGSAQARRHSRAAGRHGASARPCTRSAASSARAR